MIVFRRNFLTKLMFSCAFIILINAEDDNLEDCYEDMDQYFNKPNLLECIKYAIQHYLLDDFIAISYHLDRVVYAQTYYEDFKNMNLVISDGIRPPSTFCDEYFQDNEEESPICTSYLEALFGIDITNIIDKALYHQRQTLDKNSVDHNIHPPNSYGFNYLNEIAGHIRVVDTNPLYETYQSPKVYCESLFNEESDNNEDSNE